MNDYILKSGHGIWHWFGVRLQKWCEKKLTNSHTMANENHPKSHKNACLNIKPLIIYYYCRIGIFPHNYIDFYRHKCKQIIILSPFMSTLSTRTRKNMDCFVICNHKANLTGLWKSSERSNNLFNDSIFSYRFISNIFFSLCFLIFHLNEWMMMINMIFVSIFSQSYIIVTIWVS